MNYNHCNIYKLICKYVKKKSCQYHKTVTFNISVSQSSKSQTHGTATPPDLPPAIESKISSVSYNNATWHTDFCKQDASATACKICQTLYLCLTAQFYHTNIHEYI